MKIIKYKDLEDDFFEPGVLEDISVAKEIISEVKKKGDESVRKYTKKFDGVDMVGFQVSNRNIKKAYGAVDKELIIALKKASTNIKKFAKLQLKQFKNLETDDGKGVVLGQKIIPLQRVGCYVPGGRYPLVSTALMNVIPAKAAGVEEIIVCSPKITDEVIVACDIAGADKIFSIGGVQAIAAMAYGTESVVGVDKIVGPGNRYVAAAKKEVYGKVGIDFIAGPSEVMVVTDKTGDAELIAADLLAQAEHDPDAGCYLVTDSAELAEKVNDEIEEQLRGLLTSDVASKSIAKGVIVLVSNVEEMIDVANRKAPEHLELRVDKKKEKKLVRKLRNYGSLFIGRYSAEVFGDYCSGINHTLPTDGAARYTGGLSVKDFVKFVTYQKLSKKGASNLANVAVKIAEIEGLDAHRKAAQLRKE